MACRMHQSLNPKPYWVTMLHPMECYPRGAAQVHFTCCGLNRSFQRDRSWFLLRWNPCDLVLLSVWRDVPWPCWDGVDKGRGAACSSMSWQEPPMAVPGAGDGLIRSAGILLLGNPLFRCQNRCREPEIRGGKLPMWLSRMTARPVYSHNEGCTAPFAPLVVALCSWMPHLHTCQVTAGLVTMREQLFRGGPMP